VAEQRRLADPSLAGDQDDGAPQAIDDAGQGRTHPAQLLGTLQQLGTRTGDVCVDQSPPTLIRDARRWNRAVRTSTNQALPARDQANPA
jgi:glycine/D-amino acid oxidase-like deaminating enzyme